MRGGRGKAGQAPRKSLLSLPPPPSAPGDQGWCADHVTWVLPTPTLVIADPPILPAASSLPFPLSLLTVQAGVYLPGVGWGCLTQDPRTGPRGHRVWEWPLRLAKALFLLVELSAEVGVELCQH